MTAQSYVITLHGGETGGELTPPQMAVALNLERGEDAEALASEVTHQCNAKVGYDDYFWAIATLLTIPPSEKGVAPTQAIIDLFVAQVEEEED